MAATLSLFRALSLLLIASSVCGKIVYEEGYTVSTVVNGNEVKINPHSVHSLSGSSDLVVLDSADSSFYTLSLSQENVIKPLAGKGAGYLDGDVASAMFEKPRSFAVDLSGNIYVADRGNLAIRKISKSGVSTIAGGYSKIPGHTDGPGRNVTFSTDFELAFVPERCALMICDHGHKLIRQINLKPQDCAKGSQSVFGATAWALALAVGGSCLVGLVIGFAVRPYVTSYEFLNGFHFNATWKHYQTSLVRRVQILYFDSKNAVVNSNLYSCLKMFTLLIVSHLTLMFNINNNNVKKSQSLRQKSVSLLDSDVFSSKDETSSVYDEQMKSLISFDSGVEYQDPIAKVDDSKNYGYVSDLFAGGNSNINNLIEENFFGFVEQAKKVQSESSSVDSLGLVKRK